MPPCHCWLSRKINTALPVSGISVGNVEQKAPENPLKTFKDLKTSEMVCDQMCLLPCPEASIYPFIFTRKGHLNLCFMIDYNQLHHAFQCLADIERFKSTKSKQVSPDFTTCCLGEGTKGLCYSLNRYMSQVMRLKFTRDSHLRRFNRLLSYNLPRELEMLKYVPTQTFDAHTWKISRQDVMQHTVKELFTEKKKLQCKWRKTLRLCYK